MNLEEIFLVISVVTLVSYIFFIFLWPFVQAIILDFLYDDIPPYMSGMT